MARYTWVAICVKDDFLMKHYRRNDGVKGVKLHFKNPVQVLWESAYKAYYTLTNPEAQVRLHPICEGWWCGV
jgi:hypothetical protein